MGLALHKEESGESREKVEPGTFAFKGCEWAIKVDKTN